MADVHANLESLNAVIAAAMPFDRIWCLGDLVGYGPNPNECVEIVRSFDHAVVAGNHDWVASCKQSAAGFNPQAAIAARWTATQLSAGARQFLLDLPESAMEGDFLLVHGSPRAPTVEYLFRAEEAQRSFPHFTATYCLVGHTHVPCAFIAAGQSSSPDVIRIELKHDEPLPLDGWTRMIVNPGSVGQPRDYNPHAAFMVYDSIRRELQMQRVPYDVAVTQQKMRIANLPVPLIERLEFGI
ncbi:MAG: metallophosphoesterase family protein [Chloroflexi bacterium]|nr:metallophosphoesterase family protein [Chloroflexota bacterium]